MPGRPSGVVFAQNRALCSVKLSTPQYMLTSMELVAKTNRRQTNQWQEKRSVKKGFSEVAIFPARIGQSVQRDFIETAARQLPNRTARSVWSARSLLPLSDRPAPYDSASKLDAPQTLRANPRVFAPLRLCVDFPAFPTILRHSVEPVTNPGRRNRPGTKASHLAQPATQSI